MFLSWKGIEYQQFHELKEAVKEIVTDFPLGIKSWSSDK